MKRKIVGYHIDADGDWVAELECGHAAVFLLTTTCATAYLFCKIARPDLQVPETSKFIFIDDDQFVNRECGRVRWRWVPEDAP